MMNCSIPHIRRIESLQVVPMPNHHITGLTNSIFSICTCAFGGCRDDSQSALGRMEKWRERKEALPEIERVKRHLIVEFRMLFVSHACFALSGCSAGVALLLCSPYSFAARLESSASGFAALLYPLSPQTTMFSASPGMEDPSPGAIACFRLRRNCNDISTGPRQRGQGVVRERGGCQRKSAASHPCAPTSRRDRPHSGRA